MNKYKKHLTDEDIQVLKNTMRKHNDVKSPVELMAESIVTEQEKELLRLMYFRFTDYEQQKQRVDELEKQLNSLKEYIPSLRSAVESTLYYSHPDIELNLQSDISSYSSLMEQICKELQEDDNA